MRARPESADPKRRLGVQDRPTRARRLTVLAVGALCAVVAFVGVVQVRSQAEVVRSLQGQDNTSLAFLIDDLHRGNDAMSAEATDLSARRDALSANGGSQADSELRAEIQRLRATEGLAPVHGPGVVLNIDAPLSRLDLQDAVNNLMAAGGEAMAINEHRVITGTVFSQTDSAVQIDDQPVHGPWTIAVVGDAERLAAVADLMISSLRASDRVRSATYRVEQDLAIRAMLPEKPFVYAQP